MEYIFFDLDWTRCCTHNNFLHGRVVVLGFRGLWQAHKALNESSWTIPWRKREKSFENEKDDVVLFVFK